MIKSLEKSSIHRITSGQVLVDLQTAVKELVENSLDAGATSIEVKFKDYGLKSFEVIDNGSGIASEDYANVAMKHCTSKISSFEDLTSVETFGFRGEALSSLCALSGRVTVTTATTKEAPVGTVLEFDRIGRLTSSSGKSARTRGTTVFVEGLFEPLPVRRKEFQRNSKREFAKALNILYAYALVPCTKENKGVRLNVSHILDKNRKSDQLRTDGKPSLKSSISSLWGPKQLETLTELSLDLSVVPEKTALRRQGNTDQEEQPIIVKVRGYISKFTIGNGRTSPDRQFFFINGRPCNPTKIQKVFNEVYRSFVVNQNPFVVADFILPTNACDVNVSPDKRTILLHSENALVNALKETLEEAFAPSRSTFVVQPTQSQRKSERSSGASVTNVDDIVLQDTVPSVVDDTDDMEIVKEPRHSTSKRPEKSFLPSMSNSSPSEHLSTDSILGTESKHEQSVATLGLVDDPNEINDQIMTPARIEKFPIPAAVSNGVKRSVDNGHKSSGRSIQMTISAKDTAWEIRPSTEEPPGKRRKTSGKPRSVLRHKLIAFTSTGGNPEPVVKYNDEESESDTQESDLDEPDGDFEGSKTPNVDDSEERQESKSQDDVMDVDDVVDQASTSNTVITNEICSVPPLFLPDSEESKLVRTVDKILEPTKVVKNMRPTVEPLTLTEVVPETTTAVESPTGIEVLRTTDTTNDTTVKFSSCGVEIVWSSLAARGVIISPNSALNASSNINSIGASASLSNTTDEEGAERELARVISKEDFSRMEILGQFNLGFIISRRCLRDDLKLCPNSEELSDLCTALDDLFIIDQHAADEKFNFETLQHTTKIDSQRLYQPLPLDLTAADELLAIENVEVLRDNGFEISIDEDDGDRLPSRRRLKLVSQPISGNTNFDIKDFEELLHLLRDRPVGQKKMVRCSKTRSMFAMRACRKSIMIGTALNKAQMTSVVRHMGTMDLPWNCPHGRPTMRHLVNLNDSTFKSKATNCTKFRSISWENLV